MTVSFLAYMVIFLFLFALVLNLSKVWYSHSQSQAAADGSSLAASLKANEIVSREINGDVQTLETYIDTKAKEIAAPGLIDYETARRMVISVSIHRADLQDLVYNKQYDKIKLVYLLQEVYQYNGFNTGGYNLSDNELGYKVRNILSENENEITSYVTNYVKKNGSIVQKNGWRGRIKFNMVDGRVHVIPGTELKPVQMNNLNFPDFTPVEGDGAGPDLGYLHWMTDNLVFDF